MHLVPYKRTKTFTETTVPAGLLKDHQTKAGVYGRIVVVSGTLILTRAATEETLEATQTAVIAPQEIHSVWPVDAVSFYVEFCTESVQELEEDQTGEH